MSFRAFITFVKLEDFHENSAAFYVEDCEKIARFSIFDFPISFNCPEMTKKVHLYGQGVAFHTPR